MLEISNICCIFLILRCNFLQVNEVFMNSYFLALILATNNNKFPELGDSWRNYHPDAVLSDSDYPVLTETNEQL